MKTRSWRRWSARAGLPLGLVLSLSSHGASPTAFDDSLNASPSMPARTAPSAPQAADPLREKAIAGYRAYLKSAPADEARDGVARRLADMLIEVNESRESAGQPINRQDYEDAIQIYQDLLARHPADPQNDHLLYQIARAQSDLGDGKAAIATWARLAQQYPNSPLAAEVDFRRAESLFGSGDFAAAARAYDGVLAKIGQDRASPMVIQSLYKRGWALWRLNQYDQATEQFLKVLDLILPANVQGMDDLTMLPGASRKQAEDTLHAIALSLASTNQPRPIERFFSQPQHPKRPYQPLLYEALAQLYLDKERYTDAANTYQTFIERNPGHPKALQFSMRVIDIYERAHFGNQSLQAREAFVQQYLPKSEYWKNRQPDPQIQAKVKEYLLFLIQSYHAQSQSKQQTQAQLAARQAEKWYGVFLDNYPTDPQAPHINFQLAELRYDEGSYEDAAQAYERTAYDYPANQDGAQAAYAAVQAWDQALQKADAARRNEIRKRLIDSAQRFAQRYPQQPQVATVLLRAAEESFAMQDLATSRRLAVQAYQLAMNDPSLQAKAKTLEADAAYAGQDYAAAEGAYAQAKSILAQGNAAAHAKELAAINERLGDSVYKQGEQARERGDAAAAASIFARVGDVSPQSRAAAPARYDAATALIQAGRFDEAITQLEQFKRDYPKDPLIAELDRKLAALYVQTNQPARAAAIYAAIAERPQEAADVQREALWQAATLYQKVGDRQAAGRAFERYVQRYPQPFDLAMEARQNLLMLAQQAGDQRQADRWRQQIIAADQSAGPARTLRSRTLAAQASLELAQPIVDSYRQVRLTTPLKRSLDQKKRLLEQALHDLKQAADYQIMGVSTQAVYQMGQLYQEFAQALLDSERPRDLDAEALTEYNSMLEDQARGLLQKAAEIHGINAARAKQGASDQWIQASVEQLSKLQVPPDQAAATTAAAPLIKPKLAPSEETIDAGAAIKEEPLAKAPPPAPRLPEPMVNGSNEARIGISPAPSGSPRREPAAHAIGAAPPTDSSMSPAGATSGAASIASRSAPLARLAPPPSQPTDIGATGSMSATSMPKSAPSRPDQTAAGAGPRIGTLPTQPSPAADKSSAMAGELAVTQPPTLAITPSVVMNQTPSSSADPLRTEKTERHADVIPKLR